MNRKRRWTGDRRQPGQARLGTEARLLCPRMGSVLRYQGLDIETSVPWLRPPKLSRPSAQKSRVAGNRVGVRHRGSRRLGDLDNGLGTIAYLEGLENRSDVILHRRLRQIEDPADCLVALALHHHR